MKKEELVQLMRGLTWSLGTIILSLAIILLLPNKLPPIPETFESLALKWFGIVDIVAFFISILGFYIFLGILAKRLGRRWLIWCGLTIASSPFGFFISYFLMANLVKLATAPNNEHPNPPRTY